MPNRLLLHYNTIVHTELLALTCPPYQINESDLMRRAIVEFVTHIQQNPNQTSRHMFL